MKTVRILTMLFFVLLIVTFMFPVSDEAEMSQNKEQIIDARQKFFGTEYVNPETGDIDQDKVILSWYGVSNFAAAIKGHVVLLDAWIPRGTTSGSVPANVDELAALQPEAIFIGHSHFDHVADAPEIIERTGAVLVGTPEHCQTVKDMADKPEAISCVNAVGERAEPGAKGEVDILEGVRVEAVSHLHSELKMPEGEHKPIPPMLDISEIAENPPSAQDFKQLLAASLKDEEGGTLLYRFTVGDFSLVWNDSAGPLEAEEPKLEEVFRGLGDTDVQAGAIMGYNQYTNGLQDPIAYIESFKPKVFIPTHHDNWAPPITSDASIYEEPLKREIAHLPDELRPELSFIRNPDDYLNPSRMTYQIDDERWK